MFGWWTSSRATLSNEELYAFVALDSWRTVVAGALEELLVIHSPWYGTESLGAGADGTLPQRLLRAGAQGLPLWLTIAVFAVLAVAGARVCSRVVADRRRGADAVPVEESRALSPTGLITVCALVGITVYPVLLRASDAVTMGFDHPVVARYSIGFAPLLIWLVLLLARPSPPHEGRGHCRRGLVPGRRPRDLVTGARSRARRLGA